jgi:hypothetical protein
MITRPLDGRGGASQRRCSAPVGGVGGPMEPRLPFHGHGCEGRLVVQECSETKSGVAGAPGGRGRLEALAPSCESARSRCSSRSPRRCDPCTSAESASAGRGDNLVHVGDQHRLVAAADQLLACATSPTSRSSSGRSPRTHSSKSGREWWLRHLGHPARGASVAVDGAHIVWRLCRDPQGAVRFTAGASRTRRG